MEKQRVFITGATGTMGLKTLEEFLKSEDEFELVVLALDTKEDRKVLRKFENRMEIIWGDLRNYHDIAQGVKNAHYVFHIGAYVSPQADYFPKKAMEINYGSTLNIINAIKNFNQTETTKLIYIGTVAMTGDRMPPIHWGRVGDPLKPSVYDYYAVSKIAAERLVIESGLKYWVSLRQTGIMSEKMARIKDGIIFHNCLDNVLEYVSDRDSAILLRNISRAIPEEFWNHIYNIGGGASCRVSTYEMYQEIFGRLGIKNLSSCLDSKWIATRNFHGQYYLDSDKLNDYLDFRNDSIEYFYNAYLSSLGALGKLAKFVTKLPFGEKLIGLIIKQQFKKIARTEHGTLRFLEEEQTEKIIAYWGSKETWELIPHLDDFKPYQAWDEVYKIDHGYDEAKDPKELNIEDIKGAAEFRGGRCLSETMEIGNWEEKLSFTCAFGHSFKASPKLILEGGHWCDVCERESWNYPERAKRDFFFAQVWDPLYPEKKQQWVYKKEVSELTVLEKQKTP